MYEIQLVLSTRILIFNMLLNVPILTIHIKNYKTKMIKNYK